jgi:hypothetical protein
VNSAGKKASTSRLSTDGKLAGIISIGDVVKYRLSDLEIETSILRDAYIAAH